MSRSRFRVVGRLDEASRPQVGTVTIDRSACLFEVRPLRRRRTYVLPLDKVAEMVCRSILMAEIREKRAAKAAKRKVRR